MHDLDCVVNLSDDKRSERIDTREEISELQEITMSGGARAADGERATRCSSTDGVGIALMIQSMSEKLPADGGREGAH